MIFVHNDNMIRRYYFIEKSQVETRSKNLTLGWHVFYFLGVPVTAGILYP